MDHLEYLLPIFNLKINKSNNYVNLQFLSYKILCSLYILG